MVARAPIVPKAFLNAFGDPLPGGTAMRVTTLGSTVPITVYPGPTIGTGTTAPTLNAQGNFAQSDGTPWYVPAGPYLATPQVTGGQPVGVVAGIPQPSWGDLGGNVTDQADLVTYIAAQLAALVGGAPGALDTLKELADAINDDASFAATITTALTGKQPLDSDLTAIASLTTTTIGRSLLAAPDAASLRTILAASAVMSGTVTTWLTGITIPAGIVDGGDNNYYLAPVQFTAGATLAADVSAGKLTKTGVKVAAGWDLATTELAGSLTTLTGLSTTFTDVTGLTIGPQMPAAGAFIELDATVLASVAGAIVICQLYDVTAGAAVQKWAPVTCTTANTVFYPLRRRWAVNPGAGARSYKIQAKLGTGTADISFAGSGSNYGTGLYAQARG